MKKINFNDRYGLTEAVLSGRKTQTRRIIKGDLPLGNWSETVKHSRYQIGEIVAVAQAYKDFGAYCLDSRVMTDKRFVKAEYMPHQIRITNVRMERLQEISDEDCIKEGVEAVPSFYQPANGDKQQVNYYRVPIYCKSGRVLMLSGDTPREAYAALIDRISGKGVWDSNPWCFVYDFELVK